MSDRWLSIAEAAGEIRRSVRTIRRYVARDGLRVRGGRVLESELLEVERMARERMHAGK